MTGDREKDHPAPSARKPKVDPGGGGAPEKPSAPDGGDPKGGANSDRYEAETAHHHPSDKTET